MVGGRGSIIGYAFKLIIIVARTIRAIRYTLFVIIKFLIEYKTVHGRQLRANIIIIVTQNNN